MTRAHIHGVFIKADVFIHVCETMFTIGESRAISYANETELQAQQMAANPRRGRFSIETLLENAD